MEKTSSQDPSDGPNVQGDSTAREFNYAEENTTESKTEEQASSELLITSQPQDFLGPRQRNLTDKGLEERLNWLKQQRINALRAVTRKRTEVSQLMVDINNLHLVKNELINLNNLIEQYKEAFYDYHKELTDVDDRDREHTHHDEKIKDIMAYLYPVYAWVSQAESRLSDQLERNSNKGSEQSQASKASSRLSVRDKERVRLAELKAERSMLKQKQALRAAEEDLELELKIVKAEAREKVLNEIDREQITRPLSHDSGSPSLVASFPPIVMSSVAKSSPNGFPLCPQVSVSVARTPTATETQVKSTLQGIRNTTRVADAGKSPSMNAEAAEFNPGTFKNGTSSTPYTNCDLETPKEIGRRVSEAQSTQLLEHTFQSVVELQQKQNETIIATHQQLTAAMTLPQPTIAKFKGDPIEYKTFVMAFDTRVQSKVTTNADLLYYLNQHLEGEPKDLIEGCLHMDPDVGYLEARRLLRKEYGDPYKISTAYLNKILHWAPIKFDDNQGLKRLSIFLTKCKIAMKNISYMCVLDHAPNMQAVVSKLPFNLQAKWRDQVFKKKKRENGVTRFADLAEFVEYASESANDPVFGKEALNKSRVDVKSNKVKEPPRKPPLHREKYEEKSFMTSPSGSIEPPVSDRAGSTNSSSNHPSCHFCTNAHDLDDCELFCKKTSEHKRAFLRERNMCFGCYGTNHLSKNCLKKRKCKHCGRPHPSALHIDGFQLPKKDNDNPVKPKNDNTVGSACINLRNASCHTTRTAESVILHAILPVRVRKKGSTETVTTYAFYDNGSGGCFLTENLREQIGVDGERTKLKLGTMHGQSLVATTVVNDLVVTDMEDKNPIEIPRSYTRMEIPVAEQQIPTPEVVKQWEHLHSVAERMPKFIPNLEIGLLIGSNCPAAVEPLEVVPSGDKGPYAMRLRHGWTLSGPLQVKNTSNPNNVTCHRITVRELESLKEVVSPQAIQQMFELDFNDRKYNPDKYSYSQEDRKFISKVKENVQRCDGHYVVPLPFRNPQVTMSNNRDQALKRAIWQRKKMLRDKNYRSDYVNFVNEMIAKGYAREVPKDRLEADPGMVWYIPHHGIYHPKRPQRIRVVFESSAIILDRPINATDRLVDYFSDWHQLRRAVAVFLRIKEILRMRRNDRLKIKDEVSSDGTNPAVKLVKLKGTEGPRLPLTVQDLVNAEHALLKFVQSSAFGEEIHVLKELENEKDPVGKRQQGKKKSSIKNDSCIRRLDPFLDNGILRVGGRLRRADLPHETKHPAILPRKSHVTTLLIRHAHKRLGHAGRGHVIASLREQYWIVKVNAAVRHVISNCVFCRRSHGKPTEQKMADLPRDRISPAPPFTYTGVDYFGPFIIKDGRKEVKRYGALFTCLVSRAVHIEVASTLESSSFIQALRRFLARRGPVREIRSDNGTNFVGARKELLQAIDEMDHEEIRVKLRKEGIDWLFNPPAASHMGGVWERQIKTTRKVLAGLMEEHGHCLDEESFRTLMCEVEAIINSLI